MKTVTIKDENGYLRPFHIPDHYPDTDAEQGIPAFLIDVDNIDWEGVKRDLNNLLVQRGLLEFSDVTTTPGILESTILSVMKQRLIYQYRHPNGNMEAE